MDEVSTETPDNGEGEVNVIETSPPRADPKVGQRVHYSPGVHDAITHQKGEKLAAVIAKVLSCSMVNLCVYDANGVPQSRTSVRIYPYNNVPPTEDSYCV